LKTEHLFKKSDRNMRLIGLLFFIGLFTQPLWAQNSMDKLLTEVLRSYVKCSRIEVKTIIDAQNKIQQMIIKMDSVQIDMMKADHITLQYDNPVFNREDLEKRKIFYLHSYQDMKIGILVSPKSLKEYVNARAKFYSKKYNKLDLQLKPPYIEASFNINIDQISPRVQEILNGFIKNNQIDGYTATSIEVKNNQVQLKSQKTIINHFLIPETATTQLEDRFNPVSTIPVLVPFQYTLNHVAVQKNHLYFSN